MACRTADESGKAVSSRIIGAVMAYGTSAQWATAFGSPKSEVSRNRSAPNPTAALRLKTPVRASPGPLRPPRNMAKKTTKPAQTNWTGSQPVLTATSKVLPSARMTWSRPSASSRLGKTSSRRAVSKPARYRPPAATVTSAEAKRRGASFTLRPMLPRAAAKTTSIIQRRVG